MKVSKHLLSRGFPAFERLYGEHQLIRACRDAGGSDQLGRLAHKTLQRFAVMALPAQFLDRLMDAPARQRSAPAQSRIRLRSIRAAAAIFTNSS